MTSSKLPLISIITPCYDTERMPDIKEMLDSVARQQYPELELLLVTEELPELQEQIINYLREKGYRNIKLLCNRDECGSYAARNYGISQARGKIIAFVDDDAVLLDGWAEATANAYAEDPTMIGLTGPILPEWEVPEMAWCPREFYWIFSCTDIVYDQKTRVRNGYGTNLSFRREAFALYGLFKNKLADNESNRGDWRRPGVKETEFSLRVIQKSGKSIYYHPLVQVKHKVYRYRLSTGFVGRRSYWEGYGKAWLKSNFKPQKGKVLSAEYGTLRRILFRVLPASIGLLFRKPVVALRRIWLVTLVLTSVALGYLSYYLSHIFSSKNAATV